MFKSTASFYEDSFCYHRNKMKRDKNGNIISYLKCRRPGCPGSAKITADNKFVKIKGHTHAEEEEYKKIATFREQLFHLVKTTPLTPKEAYTVVVKENTESAELIPFANIKNCIKKWRNTVKLFNPKNIYEVKNINKNELWIEFLNFQIKNEPHSIKVIEIESNSSVCLYDEKFIKKFKDIELISIDATYYTQPKLKDAYQLVTIMGRIKEKFFPFLWVIMSGKTEDDYTKVFEHFKLHILKEMKNIKYCITDYEMALQNALKKTFDNMQLKGCYFHFIYNLRKYAKKLKIETILKTKSLETRMTGLLIIRVLYNLPLLPANCIETGFEIINSMFKKNKELSEMLQFQQFIQYVQKYWINKINLSTLSVFNFEVRTNNSQERYHRNLKDIMNHRPNFYKFILKLKDVITMSNTEIMQLENNLKLSETKEKKNMKEYKKWILEESTNLENINVNEQRGLETISNFLNCSAYKNPKYINKLKRISNEINNKRN